MKHNTHKQKYFFGKLFLFVGGLFLSSVVGIFIYIYGKDMFWWPEMRIFNHKVLFNTEGKWSGCDDYEVASIVQTLKQGFPKKTKSTYEWYESQFPYVEGNFLWPMTTLKSNRVLVTYKLGALYKAEVLRLSNQEIESFFPSWKEKMKKDNFVFPEAGDIPLFAEGNEFVKRVYFYRKAYIETKDIGLTGLYTTEFFINEGKAEVLVSCAMTDFSEDSEIKAYQLFVEQHADMPQDTVLSLKKINESLYEFNITQPGNVISEREYWKLESNKLIFVGKTVGSKL